MNTTNDFAGKLFAAFGAVAMTMTLLVSSFANPNATSLASVLV